LRKFFRSSTVQRKTVKCHYVNNAGLCLLLEETR